MRNKKLFYTFLLVIAGCVVVLFAVWQRDRLGCMLGRKTPEEKWAEKTILAYIEAKGLDIYPCTDRYNALLKGIMLGDVPELIRPPSAFIKNDTEGQYILEYAAQNFHIPEEWQSSFGTEAPVFEAVSITQPANAAYPAPATPTTLVQLQPTLMAYPTQWRDFTPTPNLTPGVWPEFSSEYSYPNEYRDLSVPKETIYYSIRYPSDWYLYPGLTTVFPGREWQFTYIQNYERIGNTPEEPLLTPGKVQLSVYTRGPCLNAIGKACPMDLPLLSPGLPGTQEVVYQSDTDVTYWKTDLYTQGYQFGLIAIMPGTPEENADLIKMLDKILATVVLQ